MLRTVEQFIAALSQPEAEGGSLRIAADADWVLTGLQTPDSRALELRAEPGTTRPRIRFRPPTADPKAPTTWSLGIDLRSGALQFEGIDLILPRDDTLAQGRWGAFGVGAGTELNLSRLHRDGRGERGPLGGPGRPGRSSPRNGNEGADADPSPAPARVQLTDSLLRSGGDLIEVTAGGQLDLEMSNVIVATGGSLVHAHGLPARPGERPGPDQAQPAPGHGTHGRRPDPARKRPGRARTPPGRDQRPRLDPGHRRAGAPLLQVDGQDDLSTLQNRIRWDGLRVAYHQINTYRRDQTAQVGTVPKIYNRPAWMVAVGPQEEAPIHGDMKFVQKWSPDRPAWQFRRDDFRLASDSPAPATGADLPLIPPAPLLSVLNPRRLRGGDPTLSASDWSRRRVRSVNKAVSCRTAD